MKLKPIYIYLILFSVVLITVISLSTLSNEVDDSNIAKGEMPNDDVHKSFQNGNQNPSSTNVTTAAREMLDELKNYVASNPDDTLKIREYAELLTAAHDEEKAIEQFRSILMKDKNRTDILSKLSILYYKRNDFLKARQYIEQILVLDPNNAEAQYNLGIVKVRVGEIDAAKKQWQDLMANHPNTKMSAMAKESLERLSANAE